MVDEVLGSGSDIRAQTAPTSNGTPGAVVAPHGFSVRYSPGAPIGHWHDVIVMEDGRTGILIGRCADADIARQSRSAARSVLLATADPVRALDRVLGSSASVLCAVIDGEKIGYSGHGDSNAAMSGPDAPGSILSPADARLRVVDLTPGATVLLCTGPAGPAAAALDRCESVHPDQVADEVMNQLAGAAVTAVLYRHPPEPLTITLAAQPASLAVSRGRLRRWLESAGVDAEVGGDVLLAVGEATANATEHAVIGATGDVAITVTAALIGGRLRLAVSDNGVWKPASALPGHRGHGIRLINALVDSAELTTTPEGTTVEMVKELRP
ncbi:MAG: ATP-binding protein [Actinomycetia bacterium]|nr:ATP-binding protein [Actinomycetes bacterium]